MGWRYEERKEDRQKRAKRPDLISGKGRRHQTLSLTVWQKIKGDVKLISKKPCETYLVSVFDYVSVIISSPER